MGAVQNSEEGWTGNLVILDSYVTFAKSKANKSYDFYVTFSRNVKNVFYSYKYSECETKSKGDS